MSPPDVPLTLDFRLYFVMFTNGTSANVSPIPKKIPPISPAKFCCQGKVLMPNRHAAINRSFIRARYGFLSCFQWQKVKMIAKDEMTPANDDKGPTWTKTTFLTTF